MKLLKYLLLILLAVVLIGFIYVAMQPSTYKVSRSQVINQPIAKTFSVVNDLKTWEEWGPWHDEDSTIVVTYGEKTIGVGASSTWTSKDGPGNMKTTALETNKSITQELGFGDYEPGGILWDFEEVSDGTKVTWTMTSDNAPFIFKIFSALSGGWDGMLGPMLENGLTNLGNVVKSKPDLYSLSEIKTVDLEDKYFIGYLYKTKIDLSVMQQAYTEGIQKSYTHAMQSGLVEGDFVPAALYHKWDEKNGETEFHAGLFLHKDVAALEGMDKVAMENGKYATISKFGPYGQGDMEAHTALGKYLEAHNCVPKNPILELYVNDPTTVKPEEVQTDIYYAID